MTFSFHTYGPTCRLQTDSYLSNRARPQGSDQTPKLNAHFFYNSLLPIDDPLSPLPSLSTNPTSTNSKVSPRPFSTYDNAALEEAWQGLQVRGNPNAPTTTLEVEASTNVTKHGEFLPENSSASLVTTPVVHPPSLTPLRSTAGDYGPGVPPRKVRNLPAIDTDEEKADRRNTGRGPKDKVGVAGIQFISDALERDTTGTPFVRASIPEAEERRLTQSSVPEQGIEKHGKFHERMANPLSRGLKSTKTDQGEETYTNLLHDQGNLSTRHEDKQARVPVGLSRLHLVEMPELQMKPIYWNPVHDICSVMRATWFFTDSMLPVEATVANLLEQGYEYMKPWTRTYADEVKSCLEIGAEAELKVVYNLWPSEGPRDVESRTTAGKRRMGSSSTDQLPTDEFARENTEKPSTPVASTAFGSLEGNETSAGSKRPYARSSIIYADKNHAQILRPNLLPSVMRGRKPLGHICKGDPIGIRVMRGFDHKLWQKLNPVKGGKDLKKARMGAIASRSGAAGSAHQRNVCNACQAEEYRPTATDLVLVIHGIGQKLSERVESFHFTHAINAFRREINMQLESDVVQPWLRQELGGIMVLPINWRATLSLDDSGEETTANDVSNDFTLKDITAETIPAVRNLISDVMLDIPYYLSHHKQKMIEAVTKEANRVYRLWCQNNPDFCETGRVHLIAHSLGSVMALDILSKQPTSLPEHLDLNGDSVHNDMFEFDTKNLFFCGSPAGFFLLLNRANLLPRKGRNKQGAEGEDLGHGIAGETGMFGCLAVDNVYNIMHYNDPIAYRVNATIDVRYANSLQPAVIPSAKSTWFQSIGSIFGSSSSVALNASSGLRNLPTRPAIAKLPSTIEMETHNFTQEEIAEKKMYLLNDNGQVDYFLSSGGGPLEIQYLNMLGAHSSYWTLQDFIRFIVVEIGRKPGREETVPSMRAMKKSWSKKQSWR